MQIKTQLDIRLSQEDISLAVANFLASHGYKMSDEEIANIKYVNTRAEGITASLTVNNESTTDEEASTAQVPVTTRAPEEKAPVDDEEEPGVIATSTVEDVMPSIDEAKELSATASVMDEIEQQQAEAPAEVPSRKSLFAGKSF